MLRFGALLFVLSSLSVYAVAEDAQSVGLVSLPNTDRYLLHSKEIDEMYRIDVALPRGFQASEKYPVVYFTDSNLMFGLIQASTGLMQLGGEIPPAIFVGIGYDVDDALISAGPRFRDLTPSHDEQRLEQARKPPLNISDAIKGGGARDFLRFIDEEVKSLIESNYPIDTDDQTIVGYSLGGLFALFVLFERPDSFNRYIAGSPSLWWDDEVLFEIEADRASQGTTLSKHVHLSSGALEPEARMIKPAQSMADILKSGNYKGLRIEYQKFEGETHASGMAVAINRGLRFVFAPIAPRQSY